MLKFTSKRVVVVVLGSVGLEEGRVQTGVGVGRQIFPSRAGGKDVPGRGNSGCGGPEVRNSTGS